MGVKKGGKWKAEEDRGGESEEREEEKQGGGERKAKEVWRKEYKRD